MQVLYCFSPDSPEQLSGNVVEEALQARHIILRHIGVYEDALARNDRWPYEWQAQIMLNRLQLGQFAEARAAYEQLLDSVDRLGNEYIPTVAEISHDVDPLFDSGQVVVDESCVLNALPPETVRSGERVRTLRYHYRNWAPRGD